MSVGVLLITHVGIGRELLNTALNTFGQLPLITLPLDIRPDEDPDVAVQRGMTLLETLDRDKQGVLILTDMFGSTPFNVAKRLREAEQYQVKMISGVNLPMLFRILNYPQLELAQLADKAVSGGKEGVVESNLTAAES